MKKFEFTLEKLKNYREQILGKEKNTLGGLRAQLVEIEKKLKLTSKLLALARIELMKMFERGTNSTEIAVHKRYITTLQQEIRQQNKAISDKEREIEKQLQVVVEATQEVSKLEKLEEKQLEDYRYQEQKEDELFIEEFVSNSSFYEK